MKKKKGRIRAVIDTNLFISGLFATKGYTHRLQDLWVAGAFERAVSEKILTEIEKTLRKPHVQKKLHLLPGEEKEATHLIREKAFVVTGDFYETDRIKEDVTDNKFLACALESKADFIVSGDRHLLALKHFHGVQIVEAKSFVRTLTR